MKVVACCHLYPPGSRVGSWLSTHEYLAELVRRGHLVDVIRLRAGVRSDYRHEGVTVHAGPGWRDRLIPAADVVVAHCGDGGALGQATVPTVRFVHMPCPDKDLTADLVIWNSETSRLPIPGRSIVLHPPVHPDRYRTTPGDHVTLVNLSKAKGVKTLHRVAQRMPESRFLGVRGGYGGQHAPKLPNLEAVRTVTDMRAVYRRTRILIAPSSYESWGRVGVEAMASGIPVIAHPTPGLVESLGDAGVFVDRDDVDGWVEQIRRLQDPTEWAAASRLATARSAELDPGDDLDRFVEEIEALC